MNQVVRDWSRKFGLAVAPLFEKEGCELSGEHNILLDGGLGTFALSVSDDEIWQHTMPAAWAWSSDIPHHVTVTSEKVAILRWDKPKDARIFSRSSVERSLGKFYSFLTEDRLRSNRTVVEHLLGLFRRIRSLNIIATKNDVHATDAFTAVLALLIDPNLAKSNPGSFGLSDTALDIYEKLDRSGIDAALREIEYGGGSLDVLKFYPALSIRHASGLLFQEAHFDLLRGPTSSDLFGLVEIPEVKSVNRGGTHFTPPALARSVVEQTLDCLPNLALRNELTICDPACGSGAFLHEALRALRARNFQGRLYIIGKDISSSAVSMARFVLHASLRDWAPAGGADVTLLIGDSLEDGGMPAADVFLMNPPFLAFGSQSSKQRDQLKRALGSGDAVRGDLSMAFVLKALEALKDNGVLGTLFPAGLLSSKAAASWRETLSGTSDIKLLASIGDFGLFAHALVRVACLVAQKRDDTRSSNAQLVALVTENDPRVTGEALRYLRKQGGQVPAIPLEEAGWNLFAVSCSSLNQQPVWNLIAPSNERVLAMLRESLPTIGDLFSVGQGIQTGYRDAFLLTPEELQKLPSKERKYFRAAIMSDSIQGGVVTSNYWLFFPHTARGDRFASEAAVKKAVPQYFKRYLQPNKAVLSNRAAIIATDRKDWWGLMRARKWSFEKTPRIISKFFAGEGGFACDLDAKYLPVTGHIWLPKPILYDAADQAISLRDILRAYVAIFNSASFVKLLSFHSPYVAGGQFDLSWRHVSSIPVPNLREQSESPDFGPFVTELISLTKDGRLDGLAVKAHVEMLVARLYGKQSSRLF